ncbi:MAG: hypothetical protein ACKO8X_02140 [Verrucomicrobiota bacterium]
MLHRLRRPLAWLALVAWLAASGLSWDLLQVVAWTKMSVENAAQRSVGAAVTKALADAPCAMCKVAQDGRKQSEQQPLAKEDAVKAKAKADTSVDVLAFLGPHDFQGRAHAWPSGEVGLTRAVEVPVPPPRARG